LCTARIGAQKFRVDNPFLRRDSRRRALCRGKRMNKKSLFHRIIFTHGVFAPLRHANPLSSAADLFFAACATVIREGFAPLTHNAAVESLFFSLCCSKRNAVQVDSRPH